MTELQTTASIQNHHPAPNTAPATPGPKIAHNSDKSIFDYCSPAACLDSGADELAISGLLYCRVTSGDLEMRQYKPDDEDGLNCGVGTFIHGIHLSFSSICLSLSPLRSLFLQASASVYFQGLLIAS